MKKIMCCFLTALFVFGCMSMMSISAEESPKYTVSNANVQVGDVFTVDVSISDNPGIISLRFKVIYDSSVVQLQGVTNTGLLNGFTDPSPEISSPYILRWADSLATADNTKQGVIVRLTFKALASSQTVITVEHNEARNSAGKKVVFNSAAGNVSAENVVINVKFVDWDGRIISDRNYREGEEIVYPSNPQRAPDGRTTYTFDKWELDESDSRNLVYTAVYRFEVRFLKNDINGDNSVNNKDVVILFRYLSGGNVNVVKEALDVNGDGKVNNKDVITLFRLISKL